MPSPAHSRSIVFVVHEPLAPDSIDDLCARVQAVAESCATLPVVCDVSSLTLPDAFALEALARVQLIARRSGTPIRIANPPKRLVDLLALVGLSELAPRSAQPLAESGLDSDR